MHLLDKQCVEELGRTEIETVNIIHSNASSIIMVWEIARTREIARYTRLRVDFSENNEKQNKFLERRGIIPCSLACLLFSNERTRHIIPIAGLSVMVLFFTFKYGLSLSLILKERF
jgi:hypothetical protein